MRYVPIEQVKEGMVLGKSLFTSNGGVLLNEDTKLKVEYIKRIDDKGIQGIYIKDEFSNEVEIPEIISQKERIQAINTIKSMFIDDEKLDMKAKSNMQVEMRKMLTTIVDSVISNRTVQMNLVDLKNYDEYTYSHSVNVALLSVAMGCGLGLSRIELEQLCLAASLHDIGKKFIPIELLNKKEKISPEEFDTLKTHADYGYRFIKKYFPNASSKANVGILEHHERYDGSGYPNQKIGENISYYGRIITVADVYDALTSKRPYHEAILPSEAYEFILGGSGTQFDPEVIQYFSKKVAAFPLGTVVQLSNDMKGIVVQNYSDFNLRPKVKIYTGTEEVKYIDLAYDYDAMNITVIGIGGELY